MTKNASRMAGRLNRNWYAVTVQTAADPSGATAVLTKNGSKGDTSLPLGSNGK